MSTNLAGLPPRYLRTPEASRFVGLSIRTLEKHRIYGTGPRYSKLGGRVVYRIEDLQTWVDAAAKASPRSVLHILRCAVAHKVLARAVLAQIMSALKLAARENAKNPLRGQQPALFAPSLSIPERSTYRALRRIRDGVASLRPNAATAAHALGRS